MRQPVSGKKQQTLWAKRSCCVRAPLDRNLEAAEGDRTEAAVRLVNARCMLGNWIAVLKRTHEDKGDSSKGIYQAVRRKSWERGGENACLAKVADEVK